MTKESEDEFWKRLSDNITKQLEEKSKEKQSEEHNG